MNPLMYITRGILVNEFTAGMSSHVDLYFDKVLAWNFNR